MVPGGNITKIVLFVISGLCCSEEMTYGRDGFV